MCLTNRFIHQLQLCDTKLKSDIYEEHLYFLIFQMLP